MNSLVQVNLRNRGVGEVAITGGYADDLFKVIKQCQPREDCVAGLGKPI